MFDQVMVEFCLFKYYMQIFVLNVKNVSLIEICLLIFFGNLVYIKFMLVIVQIVEVVLLMFVSNVWLEWGVSIVKKIKIRFRGFLENRMFNLLMYISINGFDLCIFEVNYVIKMVVKKW